MSLGDDAVELSTKYGKNVARCLWGPAGLSNGKLRPFGFGGRDDFHLPLKRELQDISRALSCFIRLALSQEDQLLCKVWSVSHCYRLDKDFPNAIFLHLAAFGMENACPSVGECVVLSLKEKHPVISFGSDFPRDFGDRAAVGVVCDVRIRNLKGSSMFNIGILVSKDDPCLVPDIDVDSKTPCWATHSKIVVQSSFGKFPSPIVMFQYFHEVTFGRSNLFNAKVATTILVACNTMPTFASPPERYSTEIRTIPPGYGKKISARQLTDEQKRCLKKVVKSYGTGERRLVVGAPGSGKSSVFMNSLLCAIDDSRRVVAIVPHPEQAVQLAAVCIQRSKEMSIFTLGSRTRIIEGKPESTVDEIGAKWSLPSRYNVNLRHSSDTNSDDWPVAIPVTEQQHNWNEWSDALTNIPTMIDMLLDLLETASVPTGVPSSGTSPPPRKPNSRSLNSAETTTTEAPAGVSIVKARDLLNKLWQLFTMDKPSSDVMLDKWFAWKIEFDISEFSQLLKNLDDSSLLGTLCRHGLIQYIWVYGHLALSLYWTLTLNKEDGEISPCLDLDLIKNVRNITACLDNTRKAIATIKLLDILAGVESKHLSGVVLWSAGVVITSSWSSMTLVSMRHLADAISRSELVVMDDTDFMGRGFVSLMLESLLHNRSRDNRVRPSVLMTAHKSLGLNQCDTLDASLHVTTLGQTFRFAPAMLKAFQKINCWGGKTCYESYVETDWISGRFDGVSATSTFLLSRTAGFEKRPNERNYTEAALVPAVLELLKFVWNNLDNEKANVTVGNPESFLGLEADIVVLPLLCNGFNACQNCPYYRPGTSSRLRLAVTRARHGISLMGQLPDFIDRHLGLDLPIAQLSSMASSRNNFFVNLKADIVCNCSKLLQCKEKFDGETFAKLFETINQNVTVKPVGGKLQLASVVRSLAVLNCFIAYLKNPLPLERLIGAIDKAALGPHRKISVLYRERKTESVSLDEVNLIESTLSSRSSWSVAHVICRNVSLANMVKAFETRSGSHRNYAVNIKVFTSWDQLLMWKDLETILDMVDETGVPTKKAELRASYFDYSNTAKQTSAGKEVIVLLFPWKNLASFEVKVLEYLAIMNSQSSHAGPDIALLVNCFSDSGWNWNINDMKQPGAAAETFTTDLRFLRGALTYFDRSEFTCIIETDITVTAKIEQLLLFAWIDVDIPVCYSKKIDERRSQASADADTWMSAITAGSAAGHKSVIHSICDDHQESPRSASRPRYLEPHPAHRSEAQKQQYDVSNHVEQQPVLAAANGPLSVQTMLAFRRAANLGNKPTQYAKLELQHVGARLSIISVSDSSTVDVVSQRQITIPKGLTPSPAVQSFSQQPPRQSRSDTVVAAYRPHTAGAGRSHAMSAEGVRRDMFSPDSDNLPLRSEKARPQNGNNVAQKYDEGLAYPGQSSANRDVPSRRVITWSPSAKMPAATTAQQIAGVPQKNIAVLDDLTPAWMKKQIKGIAIESDALAAGELAEKEHQKVATAARDDSRVDIAALQRANSTFSFSLRSSKTTSAQEIAGVPRRTAAVHDDLTPSWMKKQIAIESYPLAAGDLAQKAPHRAPTAATNDSRVDFPASQCTNSIYRASSPMLGSFKVRPLQPVAPQTGSWSGFANTPAAIAAQQIAGIPRRTTAVLDELTPAWMKKQIKGIAIESDALAAGELAEKEHQRAATAARDDSRVDVAALQRANAKYRPPPPKLRSYKERPRTRSAIYTPAAMPKTRCRPVTYMAPISPAPHVSTSHTVKNARIANDLLPAWMNKQLLGIELEKDALAAGNRAEEEHDKFVEAARDDSRVDIAALQRANVGCPLPPPPAPPKKARRRRR